MTTSDTEFDATVRASEMATSAPGLCAGSRKVRAVICATATRSKGRSDSRPSDESGLLGLVTCKFESRTSRSFARRLTTHDSPRSAQSFIVSASSPQERPLQKYRQEWKLRDHETPRNPRRLVRKVGLTLPSAVSEGEMAEFGRLEG
jgi:hypothetical protein